MKVKRVLSAVLAVTIMLSLVAIAPVNAFSNKGECGRGLVMVEDILEIENPIAEATVCDSRSATKYLSKDLSDYQVEHIVKNLSIQEIRFVEELELRKREKNVSIQDIVNSVDWNKFCAPGNEICGTNSGSLSAEYNKLTSSEKILVVLYPKEALVVKACAKTADEWRSRYYPRSVDGDTGNAYLHTFWNALMKQCLGATTAKIFADAHEDLPASKLREKLRGYTGYQYRDMDYRNNEKGRNCVKWYEFYISEKTIHNRIQKMIKNGELTILIR